MIMMVKMLYQQLQPIKVHQVVRCEKCWHGLCTSMALGMIQTVTFTSCRDGGGRMQSVRA